MRRNCPTAVAATFLLLCACSGMKMRVKPAGAPEPSLQHVVLVQLDDPKLASEMAREMNEAFPEIPQVRRWSVGPRVDTGRVGVIDWYDLGIVTQFDGVDDYKAYLEHPRHKALVAKWKPHWKRAEIVDFGGTQPEPPAKPIGG